jgi:hypothetical protein
LHFDVAADRGFGHGTYGCRELTAVPQRRQSRSKRPEFLPQDAARTAFEPVDDLSDANSRVGLDEQVDVVGHNLEGKQFHAAIFRNLKQQFFQPPIDGRCQNRATILRAPDDVMLSAKRPLRCSWRTATQT